MAFKQPTGYKRRLVVSISSPDDEVKSLKQLIVDGLTAAKVALFDDGSAVSGQPDRSLAEFLRSLQGWNVSDGFIEHGSPDSTDLFYLMTNFLGDAEDGTPFPYTSAEVLANGIAVGATSSRHYLGDIQLKDVLIYCAVGTVKINIDLKF